MADEIRYVYGWGKTKHLPGSPPGWVSPQNRSRVWALCGAGGGNDYVEKAYGARLPVCKHCQRIAARTGG